MPGFSLLPSFAIALPGQLTRESSCSCSSSRSMAERGRKECGTTDVACNTVATPLPRIQPNDPNKSHCVEGDANSSTFTYREGHLVADLGWLLAVLPRCCAAMPILPHSHLPHQNMADSGTAENKFNPTQVRDQIRHPDLRPDAPPCTLCAVRSFREVLFMSS